MSPVQERECVTRLRELASAPGAFDRDDATALVGILRCGATWDRVLELAPGLSLPAVLGAYEKLSGELEAARRAWGSIVRSPSPRSLALHADTASRLLPVPVHRALFAMEDAPSSLDAVVAELAASVAGVCGAAQAIEGRLEEFVAPSSAGVTVGEALFSTTVPGVYSDPFFLADRVSALSPVRVAELLGEPLAD
jgi:hypothetical protein